ncbi:HD family hydrolase [Hyphomicrobium sp.]|jgi:5'-deoxynucleotidase YfbR-like HD superfamily hydrolase|uniref:HD family hydrolase n=1 Tax=Hyphomicrobium sp. TaxID=82 RepID=UPI002CC276CD|nr:HD family hydrolase [Hyphomicrobium sp.]HVZ04145.1 HD family hydrolase [Hyphomicrobium sp.]
MSAEKKPLRAWQRMLSGRRLDLLAPKPEDIEIEDIAHGLARVARWNGQTVGDHAFSVAQHSVLVSDIVAAIEPDFSARELCAALLHDSPEYVVGDLISPFKAAIGLDYKSFEQKLLSAIYQRFGIGEIDAHVVSSIKHADTIAAYYEATLLAGFEPAEANLFFGRPALPDELDRELRTLTPLSTNAAQKQFLDEFKKLSRF